MIKTAIILDLISGLFFAIDYLFPKKVGDKIGRWLVSLLPEKGHANNPLSRKTLRFNAIVTCITIICFVIWAMVKDPGTYNVWQIVKSAGLYSVGLLLGVGFYIAMPLLLNKLPKRIRPSDGYSIIGITWLIAIMAYFVFIFSLKSLAAHVNVLAPALIFIITISVLLMVMIVAEPIRRYVDATPNKRVYAISRIGLVLFIVSKIIELKYVL